MAPIPAHAITFPIGGGAAEIVPLTTMDVPPDEHQEAIPTAYVSVHIGIALALPREKASYISEASWKLGVKRDRSSPTKG